MTWIKLKQDLPRHPRALKAGPEAMWLYVAGLCYCNEHTTDGVIPAEAVPTLANLSKPTKSAAALVQVGLWEKNGSDYVVLKYLEFQRSAAEIKADRKRKASAGRSGGLAKAKHRASSVLAGKQAAASGSPVPEEEVEKEPPKALPLPAEVGVPDFEDFWSEYPAQPNGTKPEKKKAHDQWVKLSEADKRLAQSSLPNYRRHLGQMEISAKYAERYLRDRSFRDFQTVPLELVGGKPAPQPVDWAKLQRESQQAAERAAGLA